MLHGDRKRFMACLLGVAEVYGKEVSSSVAGLWFSALEGYEIASIEDAFARHVQSPDTGQFMPKPADLIRLLEGTSSDAALTAWSIVDRAVRSVGPYETVAFDDPLIAKTLSEMGGWAALGMKTDDEWPFVRNEFVNRYRGYKARGQLPDNIPESLPGLLETQNAKFGLRTEVKRIGGKDNKRITHKVSETA